MSLYCQLLRCFNLGRFGVADCSESIVYRGHRAARWHETDRAKVAALFLGGKFPLGWSYYHFLRAYNDMWSSKVAGEIAGLRRSRFGCRLG
jgi:hypothetical protein